ncbi:class II fructose-bisphosphate aldolase [Microcella alkaliphila]|uniref:Tagatose-bisphosphate aldolase n=1 Tax=Microcella alkaliphila TaxID=279828 RepID=A0A0U5B5N5_9MICO|nr:class II fructose-bisphosphate aldolase [Microcella alkaliphila]BAU31232.1 tagatose-bisphosphate aldolase [Microcella alkaliphila]
MALTDMASLLRDYRAVGAFNFVQLELAEAIVLGAEEAGAGAVLQLSENAVRFHGSLAPAAYAALRLADQASTPIVVHLDHATDEALVDEAIALGVPSIMFDAAHLPESENVERTREVAQRAHTAGVWVEAELGEIGGKGGAHTPGVRTNVDDAVAFCAATGVDALAVAVGSSHAMTHRDAQLDNDLIRRLARSVPVPLVLHGSSGVADSGIDAAIRAGMRKINIGTHVSAVMTHAVRKVLSTDSTIVDPRTYLAAGRSAVASEVARLLRVIVEGHIRVGAPGSTS